MGQASISVSVDMVTLQVLVTDNKGNALTGLKPENFTIYEDNVKQEIKSFSPVDANITVVMLVEYSNNIQYFIDEVWNAMSVLKTISAGSNSVIGYDMNTRIMCDFTQNRQELHKALRQFMYPSFWESNPVRRTDRNARSHQELEGKVAVLC